MTRYANALAGTLLSLMGAALACSPAANNGGSTDSVSATCGNGVVEPGEECDGAPTVNCGPATNGQRPYGRVACVNCFNLDTACYSISGSNGGSSSGGGPGNSTGGQTSASGGTESSGGTSGSANGGATSSGGASGSGNTSSGGITSTGGTTSTGGATSTNALGDIEALRKVCLDTINSYRKTVGAPNLTLAPAAIETCSDTGASQDAATNTPHGSFGKCQGMNAQDTCPGWNPKQYGGVEGALKACMASMWAEGMPAEGRDQCLAEYFATPPNTACFMAHGHYLNMSDPGSSVVACGFYLMPNGDVWMNQDFGG